MNDALMSCSFSPRMSKNKILHNFISNPKATLLTRSHPAFYSLNVGSIAFILFQRTLIRLGLKWTVYWFAFLDTLLLDCNWIWILTCYRKDEKCINGPIKRLETCILFIFSPLNDIVLLACPRVIPQQLECQRLESLRNLRVDTNFNFFLFVFCFLSDFIIWGVEFK